MKKQFISKLLFGVTLMVAGGSIWAQDTIPIKTLPPVTVTATQKNVPEKVWNNFQTYFSNAENPTWYKINKDYLIKFMTNEELNRSLFNERGKLIYHISYGYERSLPEEIRKQVRSAYYDYTVTRAIKVTEANRVVWVVNLEDAGNLILVRLENGEMEEVQSVKKS